MGLPTVGSRINGLVDAVADGETGILVEPKNHLALAVALKELLENKELRLRLGRRAHERALKIFAANRVNSALLVEYERLLDCCKS